MLLFGITGGIGSGKSAVSDLLRHKDVPVLDADDIARALTTTLPAIRQALIDRFGKKVFTAAGELDKEHLRELVFSDPKTREEVNAIIHPHVLEFIRKEVRRLFAEEGHTLIGVEAALIFEADMDQMLNKVVAVDAPVDLRIERIAGRDGLSMEEISMRISSQMPHAEKVSRADFVVDNSGDLESLAGQAELLLRWLGTEVTRECGTPPV